MWLKRVLVGFLESLCGAVDGLPSFGYNREDGWWFRRYSDWGCYPLHLSALSVHLDDKWHTGIWQEEEEA